MQDVAVDEATLTGMQSVALVIDIDLDIPGQKGKYLNLLVPVRLYTRCDIVVDIVGIGDKIKCLRLLF